LRQAVDLGFPHTKCQRRSENDVFSAV